MARYCMRPRKSKKPTRRPPAAVHEILGIAPRPIPSRWRKQFGRLKALREALTNRQTELSTAALEEQPSFSSHMADAGTDEYDRDFALGMLSCEQDALYQIEQALDRIRNGTY